MCCSESGLQMCGSDYISVPSATLLLDTLGSEHGHLACTGITPAVVKGSLHRPLKDRV